MPIDPEFQKNRKKVGKENGIAIWGPVDPPEKLGICGTYVAVDWDLCTGCGVCLKVCPQLLFEWVETSGHPTSERKAFPAREPDCVQCYKCETKCPVKAIRIVYYPASGQGPTGWLFLLFPIIVGVGAVHFIRMEEARTLGHYGAAYREYMNKTPRWIGIPKSKNKKN